jgi:hypothetical protein
MGGLHIELTINDIQALDAVKFVRFKNNNTGPDVLGLIQNLNLQPVKNKDDDTNTNTDNRTKMLR